MGKNLYIADWHYGHKNILAYDNRPFFKVSNMNKELIKRWNDVVNDDDTVYVLGDMFWCGYEEAIPVLKELKGHKILIKGNHDNCNNDEFVKQFDYIVDYLEIVDNGKHIVLSHYPIICFKNMYDGWYHLYGHVHQTFDNNMVEYCKKLYQQLYKKSCNMFNVGAMMPYINYTPRTLEDIVSKDDVLCILHKSVN